MVLIDEQGVVRYRHDGETPAGFQTVDDLSWTSPSRFELAEAWGRSTAVSCESCTSR